MTQTWNDLLFAHWALPPDAVRPLVPAGLTLDVYDGYAWVGVVPFTISNLRPRWLPPLPLVSSFIEMNVRTYVVADGKPGVWFFSLDASNRLAVEGARLVYHLPYFNAAMDVRLDGDTVYYTSLRADARSSDGEFRGAYRPTSPVFSAESGSLDAWLTERYCLYAAWRSRLYRSNIHHKKWSLQRADATIDVNTVADAHGIMLDTAPPVLHFAKRLEVLVWGLERVNGNE